MMKSRRRRGGKRRPQVSLSYAVAVVSSFILSGMSPFTDVSALESTEKLNREDIHEPRVLQHGFGKDKLRSKNQYLLLKGQSESSSQRRGDRQLVKNKEKKTRTGLRNAQKRVKMKRTSASVNQPQTSSGYTMVTKTAGQTTRMKTKNPLKEQMIRARLEKRTEKKMKRINQGGKENYTSQAKTFLGNLELKLHQQVGSGRGKSDWYDRRTGKPSGGWNNNRWSDSRRPGGSRSGGKPGGWKSDGWESDRWKPVGGKPRDWWSVGERTRDWWSGGGGRSGSNNWAGCQCTYIDPDPVEGSGSLWSWTGSSWSWGGKVKVCTCEPTYKPTFYPTYYPT